MSENATHIYRHKIIEDLTIFYGDLLHRIDHFPKIKDHLNALAFRMWEGVKEKESSIFSEINNYHKSYLGKPIDELMNLELTVADCRQTIANEHGFENWEVVESLDELEYDRDFELAVNMVLNGYLTDLKKMVEKSPDLVHHRSKYGHGATLLHYVGTNGVEFWRQIVPNNLPEITKYLLEMGADKNAKMKVYGGEFNTLQLTGTSAHPFEAGIGDILIGILRDKEKNNLSRL